MSSDSDNGLAPVMDLDAFNQDSVMDLDDSNHDSGRHPTPWFVTLPNSIPLGIPHRWTAPMNEDQQAASAVAAPETPRQSVPSEQLEVQPQTLPQTPTSSTPENEVAAAPDVSPRRGIDPVRIEWYPPWSQWIAVNEEPWLNLNNMFTNAPPEDDGPIEMVLPEDCETKVLLLISEARHIGMASRDMRGWFSAHTTFAWSKTREEFFFRQYGREIEESAIPWKSITAGHMTRDSPSSLQVIFKYDRPGDGPNGAVVMQVRSTGTEVAKAVMALMSLMQKKMQVHSRDVDVFNIEKEILVEEIRFKCYLRTDEWPPHGF